MTELSRVIRNCPVASVSNTSVAPLARVDGAVPAAAASVGPEVTVTRAGASRERLGADLDRLAYAARRLRPSRRAYIHPHVSSSPASRRHEPRKPHAYQPPPKSATASPTR